MSENVLQVLLRLFALVALEDEVTEEERQVVHNFLEGNLASAEVQVYMQHFERYLEEKADTDAGAVAKAAAAGLSRKQQVVVLMHLFELVLADQTISEGEEAHLALVIQGLSIEESWVKALRKFACANSAEAIDGPEFLRMAATKPAAGNTKFKEVRLEGELVVLNIGDGLIYLIKYFGEEYLQLNHHYFPPNRNHVLRHGSVLSLPHGTGLYFSDIVREFLPISLEEQLSFSVEDLEYRFPKGNQGLHPLNLQEHSGRLVAIMGASGSGKSTLLNVLNGNLTPSKGKVCINATALHDDLGSMKGLIGYVPQDDLLIEDLTVYQNLYFNAKLCHKDLDHDGLNALVERVLTDLGLTETSALKVGNALNKTISGGQRKRLNIGLELLRAPAIIFFDEPTSGLSSRDSENTMDLLKELTFKGKLIFVVIHQPSSDIFKMFDSLLVLDTGGYPAYYGNPVDAVVYFRKMSEQVSQNAAACNTCGNINPEQIFNIIEGKVIDEYGNVTAQRKCTPKYWNELYLQAQGKATPPPPQKSKSLLGKGLLTPSWLRQFGVFFRRDLLSKLGNKQYLAINLLQAPILALILGVLVRFAEGGGAYNYGQNENIPAFFFMSIVVSLFVGMTMSAEEIFRDRKILKRESFLSLSRSGYLLSKTGILFAFMAFQMACFVAVGALVLQLPALYLGYWLMLFSLGSFAILLGMNISATFDSAVTIYILIPLMLIPQLILSGTVVRFDRLNPGFTSPKEVPVAADLMASRWAYEGLMVHFFKSNAYQSRFFKAQSAASEAVFFKDYWVPEMASMASFVGRHQGQNEPDSIKALVSSRTSLLSKQLEFHKLVVADLVLPCADSLKAGAFSSTIEACVLQYLETAKFAHVNAYGAARKELDKVEKSLGQELEGKMPMIDYQRRHHNDAIDKLVRNSDSGTRLLEQGDDLVRTFEPVYHYLRAPKAYSYRTHFYSPDKPFLGMRWDTFAFNVGVIWAMCALLYGLLYFEVFRKLLRGRKG
jgi:ABC-type multidrug transport system ATPase subunit